MKAAESAQKAHRWRGWGGRRSKKTDETHFKLSKCGEEFSGLKKDIGGKVLLTMEEYLSLDVVPKSK